MKLDPSDLDTHLRSGLRPAYLVSGDEPLLAAEAADAIRAAARAADFGTREVFYVERSAPWNDILHASQALSLFAERRILEIRMPGGKPGTGARILQQVIESAGQDYVLLVLTGKLDRDAQAAEWTRSIERRGAWVPVWPVALARFPAWIARRMRESGLEADDEAVALLAERTEGNLLAAQQEIDKLVLQGSKRVDAAAVAAGVADSTHFDVFRLGEAAAAGDAPRVLRILDTLRNEGTEPPLVLWSLLRERARTADAGGRQPAARIAERAARADRMIKGQLEGDAWDEIMLLALEFCGVRALPLPRR